MLRLDNVSFFRSTGEPGKNAGKIPVHSPASSKRVKYAVSLTAFKSIAISPFAFPFNNVLRVREALRLQNLPYAAAGEMELFPSVLEKTSRSSSGVAMYISSGELKNPSMPVSRAENMVWPAPLAMVSRVAGEGVTFWLDEENICSMLWRGKVPVLYRWKPRAGTAAEAGSTIDSELAWYELYCKSRGEEVGAVFVMDAAAPSELAKVPGIAMESLALCPWMGGVNISRGALDSAVTMERSVRSLSKVLFWVLVIGLIVFVGDGLRWYEARLSAGALRAQTAELYRSVFEPSRTGAIADPVGLARSAVQQLKGGLSYGRSISETFSDLGAIFEQNPDIGITLDVTRYNPDGVDCTGSAPDMETVQEFRAAWAGRAGNAQIGNLSTIPGGSGYRFDLYVRW